MSGKYLKDPQAKGRVTEFKGFAQRYAKPLVAEAVAAYVELAAKHGMTPAQLALAFVYSRWFVASTIIGATDLDQLQENIAAMDIEIEDSLSTELKRLQLRYFNPAP